MSAPAYKLLRSNILTIFFNEENGSLYFGKDPISGIKLIDHHKDNFWSVPNAYHPYDYFLLKNFSYNSLTENK